MGFPRSSYTRWSHPGPHPLGCRCGDDGLCDEQACRERDQHDEPPRYEELEMAR